MEFKVKYIKGLKGGNLTAWEINDREIILYNIYSKQEDNLIKSLEILSKNIKNNISVRNATELLNTRTVITLITEFFMVDFLNCLEFHIKDSFNNNKEPLSIYSFLIDTMGIFITTQKKVPLTTPYIVEFRDIVFQWITQRISELNIEEHLKLGKETVHIAKVLGISNYKKVLRESYTDSLLNYIDTVFSNTEKNRELPNYSDLCYKLVGQNNLGKPDNEEDKEFITLLKKEFNSKYKEYGYRLISGNSKELDLNKDKWILYSESDYQGFQCRTIDFSMIEGKKFKKEFKWYYKELAINILIENRNLKNLSKYIYRCSDVVNYFYFELGIDGFNEVDDFTAQLAKRFLMFDIRDEETGETLKPATISKIITELKKIVDYLVEEKVSTIKHQIPTVNVFDKVKVFNIRQLSDSSDVIPDVVVDKIEEHIEELKIDYQRMFHIFQGTGMRAKEVIFLEEDCLDYSHINDSDINKRGIILSYIPYKVLLSQRKQRKSDRHEIYITESLAKMIEEQIKQTSFLRKRFEVPYIFISDTCEYIKIQGRGYSRIINSLIKKHNICDIDGTLWRFDSRQMRATVASNMIENGACENEIMSLLNHNDVNTTRRYYEKVKKLRLAQLNEEFFKKEFELKVGKEQLEQYNEEERKILFVEFATTTREVEFGKCIKHDSEGVCKRGGEFACANCNKICTGKQYLPKWESLLNNQSDIVETLKMNYQKNGIDESEYTNYIEYIREVNQLNYYKSVIEDIRG